MQQKPNVATMPASIDARTFAIAQVVDQRGFNLDSRDIQRWLIAHGATSGDSAQPDADAYMFERGMQWS